MSSKEKWIRIQIQSECNEDMCFDISVPEHNVDRVKELVPIAGGRWYNDPECEDLGYAEPLLMMLEDEQIPYEYHLDHVEEPDIWLPFV